MSIEIKYFFENFHSFPYVLPRNSLKLRPGLIDIEPNGESENFRDIFRYSANDADVLAMLSSQSQRMMFMKNLI
jgi:hypothetical protein